MYTLYIYCTYIIYTQTRAHMQEVKGRGSPLQFCLVLGDVACITSKQAFKNDTCRE